MADLQFVVLDSKYSDDNIVCSWWQVKTSGFAFWITFYFVLYINGAWLPYHCRHLIYVNITCSTNIVPCGKTIRGIFFKEILRRKSTIYLLKYLIARLIVYFAILCKLHHHYFLLVKLLLITKYRYTSENKKVTPIYLFRKKYLTRPVEHNIVSCEDTL